MYFYFIVCKGAFLTKQRENEIIKTNYRKTVKAKGKNSYSFSEFTMIYSTV